MATYWVTFRIANQTIRGASYDDRYGAMRETIRVHATKWWVKPTSFIAFSSQYDIKTISTAISRTLDGSHDLFLIREMDKASAVIYGANDDPDIFALMPYLEVLS